MWCVFFLSFNNQFQIIWRASAWKLCDIIYLTMWSIYMPCNSLLLPTIFNTQTEELKYVLWNWNIKFDYQKAGCVFFCITPPLCSPSKKEKKNVVFCRMCNRIESFYVSKALHIFSKMVWCIKNVIWNSSSGNKN